MKTLVLTLLLIATSILSAQQPTDAVVRQVNDRRGGKFFAQLSISMNLPQIKNSEVAASRVLVTSATDSSGADLVDRESSEPPLESNQRADLRDKTAPASVTLSLKNPPRSSKSVKEVRGEIELFMPSKDPNSIAEISRFLPASGKALTHKALKANGVEITFLTKAQLDAERKRRSDKQKKEYEEYSYDAESLKSALDSFNERNLVLEENELLVRIKDPEQRIQDLKYLDDKGETAHLSKMDDEDGLFRLSTWSGKPQPTWKLMITMRTAKNTARYSFALKDVPLP